MNLWVVHMIFLVLDLTIFSNPFHWRHILGQDYRKRAGDKKGEGVYFLLRINSRREIDGNAPSLLMLKEEFL